MLVAKIENRLVVSSKPILNFSVMTRMKNCVQKFHWHHHVLRGAVLAHVTHVIIISRKIDADTASDVVCGIFVFTEYLYALREISEEEKKEAAKTSKKVAA